MFGRDLKAHWMTAPVDGLLIHVPRQYMCPPQTLFPQVKCIACIDKQMYTDCVRKKRQFLRRRGRPRNAAVERADVSTNHVYGQQ